MKNNKHVVPNPTGGWDVKSGGHRTSHHNTQQSAIQSATVSAQVDRTDVVIHGRDGKIRENNSYGKDPFPPKG